VLPAILPDGTPGSDELGDGLSWLGGATATIDGLTLSGNFRTSVLINEPVGVGSTIKNPVLSGGDDQKGILYQRVPTGGQLPTVEGAAAPTESPTILSIAVGPAVPAP
jgi:hypothetical protein